MRLRRAETSSRRWLGLAMIAAALLVGYYLLSRQLGSIDLHHLLEEISTTLGAWTYLLVGVFAFAEAGAFVGLIIPGETVMLLGGAVAGQGAINIYLLIAIAWFAAWLGDSTSFFIGRRLGRDFVLSHGPHFGIGHERFERVEDYFSRYGGKTIFIGRFISLVRAFAPFIAGSSGMRYRDFLPYSILGCGLWASAHILIGYFFSRSIDTAAKYAGTGALVFASLIVLLVLVVVGFRYLRWEDNRRKAVGWMLDHAGTRWLVVLARRFQPQLRFLWDRVTPGGTFGLEFTSLMAALAVALFVLIAYAVHVGHEPGPTPGDITAIEVVENIRSTWLTELAKVFNALGSGALTWSLTVLCAVLLAIRRRWAEFAVLLAGMTLIYVGFHAIQVAASRPRPPEPLIEASGSSFPSGHAAYSVLYVWLAVTMVLRLRPAMTRGAAVLIVGLGLTVLIGLSRVYLGVHYLSDVSAGWALGVAAFTLSAATALVISQLRQNPER